MTHETELVAPTIHMNGTSKERLLEELNNCWSACDDAICAIRSAAPNGRDYYINPGSLEAALDQHLNRMKRVSDVQDELGKLIEMVDAQGSTRQHATSRG